ncbi:MAG: MarR family transcriptional regulator [Nakamurella sp.]
MMEAAGLYRLIRQLRTVAGAATAGDPEAASPSSIAVIEDLVRHPDSSINQIVGRTGLVQSMVSNAVAQLRADGLLQTAADPRDRRRTLVSLNDSARQDVSTPRAGRSIDEALQQIRPDLDVGLRAELVHHLETIARLLDR